MRWDQERADGIYLLTEKVDRRVLRWFGHVERMDEGRWPRKVKAANVEGRHERGRPRFSWLDGMKRVLAVREVSLQEATQFKKERSVWREPLRT